MHREPEKRFQDAQSAIEALRQCMTGAYKPVGGRPPMSKTGTAMHPKIGATRASTSKPQSTGSQGHLSPVVDKPVSHALRSPQSKVAPLLTGAVAAVALLGGLFYISQDKTAGRSGQPGGCHPNASQESHANRTTLSRHRHQAG